MIAIVDYGTGNLFSVRRACESVDLQARITSSKEDVIAAEAVILPGVGAFGDAMATLRRLDLVGALRDAAASGKPFVGICLGLQLLMSESFEFGHHKGLGVIDGSVCRFENPMSKTGKRLKVPQVGWNRIHPPTGRDACKAWKNSLLEGMLDGEFMYFVHSYYVRPGDGDVVLSVSRYGDIEFCSSLQRGSIFACQFHPERSGLRGLKVYENLASCLRAG